MMKLFLNLFLVFVLGLAARVQADEWRFDQAHTNVGFSITHLVISDVTGRFKDFDGTFTSPGGDDFNGSQVSITIKTTSIDTDNEKRDNHLRSADFFNVEKNPEITFKSTSFKKVDDTKYQVSGKLTMNGVTRDITLDAILTGVINDPWGGTRAGFKATAALDRYDYNLKYNTALETGGFLIGKNVDLIINVELIKK